MKSSVHFRSRITNRLLSNNETECIRIRDGRNSKGFARFDIDVHARKSFHVIVRWRQRYRSRYPRLLAASFNTVLKTLPAGEKRYMNHEYRETE